ncbi:hypothetical protein E4P01_11710 [Pseudomonas sp. NCIMB 10586]|nr:hypothetical protein [Pseudomonas sp. NCIMB 10586]
MTSINYHNNNHLIFMTLTLQIVKIRTVRALSKYATGSGLMKPDTRSGENARQIQVSDDQTTPRPYS